MSIFYKKSEYFPPTSAEESGLNLVWYLPSSELRRCTADFKVSHSFFSLETWLFEPPSMKNENSVYNQSPLQIVYRHCVILDLVLVVDIVV